MNSVPFSTPGKKNPDLNRFWYAVYVRSRQEKVVYRNLEKQGVETSLPLLTKTRQWSDRKKDVQVPWFPGYVFVKIDLNTEKFVVLETKGVVKFVPINQKALSIPEQELYWLQELLARGTSLRKEIQLPVGALVQVLYGPFKGCQGKLIRRKSDIRMVVWIEAIMQGVSVELNPSWLDTIPE
jgi:transcription antitermination factor NusG